LLEKRTKNDPNGMLACPSKTCDFAEKVEPEKIDTASVA
jgi:hypothetical protein